MMFGIFLCFALVSVVYSEDCDEQVLDEQCISDCTSLKGKYDPYCGTNGKTYPNKCELYNAICRSNANFDMHAKGKCDKAYAVQMAASEKKASPDSCKLEQLGCFSEKFQERALPEQILNERDLSSALYSGKLIDWKNYKKYLDGFACRCARLAAAKGYSIIGLQFFGECWSGPKAEATYQLHGLSGNCINGDFKKFNESNGCVKRIGKSWTNYVYRIGNAGCGESFEPIGCFHDDLKVPRNVPNYIMNDRDPSAPGYSGHMIKWEAWDIYMPKMVCRCAAAARARGDVYFSIQFWGECWSGKQNTAATYSQNGASTECVNEYFKPCSCNSYNCVGKKETNYVYKLTNKCSTKR